MPPFHGGIPEHNQQSLMTRMEWPGFVFLPPAPKTPIVPTRSTGDNLDWFVFVYTFWLHDATACVSIDGPGTIPSSDVVKLLFLHVPSVFAAGTA